MEALADAQKWLADHPEAPAKSERYFKGATRGDTTYSLSLSAGRLSLFRWHGEDSESMDFGGTVADFNQFDDERPEEWFDVAAKMIEDVIKPAANAAPSEPESIDDAAAIW